MLQDLIPPTTLDALITAWLTEDTPTFDHGGHVVGDKQVRAILYQKTSPILLAGTHVFTSIFARLSCRVEWCAEATEGAFLHSTAPKTRLAVVTGAANRVLLGERVALNVLSEMCAIATAAHRAVAIAQQMHWHGRVAGTRKTTPGFRLLQKYAMIAGGMDAHRMDLSSMVMLKDNHIRATGSITAAVQTARKSAGFSVKIDVECADVEQALEACRAGADVVMLDNFKSDEFASAAERVKDKFPGVVVEGSGGLSFDTLKDYMVPHADVLSFSVQRHAQIVDLSLKVE